MDTAATPEPPSSPATTPPPPHSGEGASSALEALKRAAKTKPAAKERTPDCRAQAGRKRNTAAW